MDDITVNLNCKAELYKKQPFENDLGEDDFTYQKVKDIWVQIIPTNTKANKSQFGNVDPKLNEINVSHKIKARYLSCKDITIDSYFVHDGIKFDVISFNRDYKNRSYMDISANVRYE